MSNLSTFKEHSLTLIRDLNRENYGHFPNIKDHLDKYSEHQVDTEKYVKEVQIVLDKFEERFCDFLKLENLIKFYINPFKDTVNIESIATQFLELFKFVCNSLEDDIMKLGLDIRLKAMSLEDKF